MNIGDYVRTDTGKIGKITLFEGDLVRIDTDKFITYKSYHNEITKISPNIIDLIEVGDYVNGKKVEWIGYGMYQDTEDGLIGIGDKFILFNEFTRDGAREKDIKSIITKEMFANAEYRVESN